MYNVHSLCKNTGTDFSQFLLAAAKLYFCWIVVFPRRNHSPEGQMCVLPSSHTRSAPAAVRPFWEGSGTTFEPGNASVRKAASCWRSVAPKVVHNPLRDGPKCPKGLQKLAFRPLWATLLEQIGEGAVFEINILFTMFSSHRATPGLSAIAPLTSLEAECGPEPAFLCPLAPTGAPKRRRRSP